MKYMLHCHVPALAQRFFLETDWVPQVGEYVQYKMQLYRVLAVIRYLDSPEAAISLQWVGDE